GVPAQQGKIYPIGLRGGPQRERTASSYAERLHRWEHKTGGRFSRIAQKAHAPSAPFSVSGPPVFRKPWKSRKHLLQYLRVPAFPAGTDNVMHFLRVLALFQRASRGK